ncbi:NAD(P)-dependent oxidoreductase [Variovorax sp. HJSM1_2]|uniref:NAD(P)-dependent oxidoreductase n=1 Tax=Variovorax sp. HJSM1_2 TaxID=3366263 RepID=UPI003BD61EEC
MKVGCVNFGPLGHTLIQQLALKHDVLVFDATRNARAQNDIELSALVRASDVIVVCGKPLEENLHDVVFEHGDFASNLEPGKIVVDLTAGDPESTRVVAVALSERGVQLVDAPVHAEIWADLAAHAAIFCGGDAATLAKVKPLLEVITPRVVLAGASGNGHATYLVVQAIAICNRVVTCECAGLGARQGLTMRDMDTVLNNSSGRSSATERLLPSFYLAQPTADVPLGRVVQDLQLFCKAAASFGAPVLIGNLARSVVEMAYNELSDDATLDDVARFYESVGDFRFADA